MRDQTMHPLSRRSFLTGLAGASAAGAGLLAPVSAHAQAFPAGFSSFSVDVRPLKAKGLGPFADLVGQAALDQLHRSFADRVDPRGPRFVLVITGIFLTAFPDNGTGWRRHGGGGGGSDGMDGEALAIGPRGEILARHPQHAARDPDTSSLNPNEQGRAVAMAQHYVWWLRRRL